VPAIETLIAVLVAAETLIVQSVVFSEAETPVTNVICDVLSVPKNVAVAVLVMNTAVAVASGTSIKNHAVPSLAIAQSRVAVAVFVIGKNRFIAETVFGGVV
jgi:hypothetical protein